MAKRQSEAGKAWLRLQTATPLGRAQLQLVRERLLTHAFIVKSYHAGEEDGAEQAAKDRMVLISELDWPDDLPVSHHRRLKFLDEHKIPHEQRGRRRFVDAAVFARVIANRNTAGWDALDVDTLTKGIERRKSEVEAKKRDAKR